MAGRRHPGFVALDKCEKQVKITIRNHLDEIATFLKDSNIIDHTLYNDVTNPESREIEENKAKKLFMRLQCMVEENEDYYHKFVEFLRKNEVFEKIVALLDEAYTGKIPEPESVRVPASSNGGAGNFSEMVDGPVETDEAAKEKQQGEKPLKDKECKEIKIPKPKQDDLHYGEFCKRVQYVFSIVNNDEFNAATTMIMAPDIEDGSDVITTIDVGVYIGMMGRHPVGLIRHEPGRNCAESLTEGIKNFPKAEYLVAVGVCYGFSRGNTELADVLISKKIIDLGSFRISENSIEIRGDHTKMKAKICKIFCDNAEQVKGLQVAHDRYAKHLVGNIVSGSILVDNADIKEKINYQVKPKAYGGEMEGGELLRLQKDGIVMPDGNRKYILVIVIKAVTDFADGTKNKEWQFIGAQAAFHYVKSKMKMQNVKYPKRVINKDGLEADGSVELAEETKQVSVPGKNGGARHTRKRDPDLMADSECTPPPPKRKRIQLSQGIGRSAKDGIEADGPVEPAEETQQEKPDFTRELNIKDLPTIREYIFEARVEWYNIGMALNLGTDDLDEIEDSNAKISDRLRVMLTKWLQKGENRRWSAIIKALESKAVRRLDVAEKIKKPHYV